MIFNYSKRDAVAETGNNVRRTELPGFPQIEILIFDSCLYNGFGNLLDSPAHVLIGAPNV
jgi:hypothetical protein